MNYAWWINTKDSDGLNVFEGGFLGLDNISVFDRSARLPEGYKLKQSDATGWMAMFALNMTVIALELATDDSDYEDTAIQTYEQFLNIANSVAGHTGTGVSLWDPEDGFFKDLLVEPDGRYHRVDVYSWVGLIPLFACEILDERLLHNVPRFHKLLDSHAGGVLQGNYICACPVHVNDRGEHLPALVNHTMLQAIIRRLFDEQEFLSPYGIRSVSRIHVERRDLGILPGIGQALIEYVPGESNSGLFGGNSNWRGPLWLPTNYTLMLALEKFNRYLGDRFTVPAPGLGDGELTLGQIVDCLARRMTNLYRPDPHGRLPAFAADSPWQHDPHWREHLLFYEYFHGDNGLWVWGRRIRPAGPGFWLTWCCVVTGTTSPDSISGPSRIRDYLQDDGGCHEYCRIHALQRLWCCHSRLYIRSFPGSDSGQLSGIGRLIKNIPGAN